MEEEQHHHYGGGGGGGSSANTTAMVDLRQFFSPIPTHHHHFPAPPSLFSPAAAYPHHYDTMMLVMGGGHDFRAESSAACASTAAMIPASSAAGASATGFDMDNAGGSGGGGFGLGVGGGDGGATARWPRQETLTLLEIRSRLDHKFKEANHKGPLWDEVSRIMSDEHGYQRSGKKCREKFENLYKYYKKTKEGKAGRQDGKHYRFFRQLEALYGEPSHHPHPNPISDHTHLDMISNHTATPAATTTATAGGALQFHNTMNNHQEGFQSISLSNTSSDFDTSSSEGDDRVGSMGVDGDSSVDRVGRSRKRRGSGRGWKAKIKEFIDSQMRRIMEKQEAWLERMMRSLENKEKERLAREEEWRKQEVMRMEREHKFWAKERAWIEARDKALMDALQRITGKKVGNLGEIDKLSQHGGEEEEGNNEDVSEADRWGELEIIKLMELRASIQSRFDECGGGPEEGDLWEEISTRMACLGHDRSPKMCKEKWDFISKELSNKRKEVSLRAGPTNKSHQYQHQEHHLQTTNLLYNYGHEMNGQGGMGLGPPQIGLGGGNPVNDSCLRILLGDGGETNPWESYGVKLNKGESTH